MVTTMVLFCILTLLKAANHVTGNKELFPYDVSINLIRNADFTRIHTDVGYHGEEEYTCLVYLNPNWNKDYYGETGQISFSFLSNLFDGKFIFKFKF